MSLNYEYEKQLVKHRPGSYHFYVIFFIILLIIIGLRYEVGGDWPPYRWYYERAGTVSFIEYIALNEIGYALINLLSYHLSAGISFVNLCCALIFIIGLYKFALSLPRPWLGFVVASPYLIVVIAMGFSRQGVAIALTMYAIKFIKEGKNYLYALFIIFACLFHVSAILLLPLVLLQFIRKNILFFFLGLGFVFITIFYYYDTLYNKAFDYISLEIISNGTHIRLLMNLLPACIFIFFINKFNITKNEKLFWLQMSFLAFIFLGMNFIFPGSTIIDRLGFYLISLQMFVYSYLPGVFGNYKKKNKFWVLMVIFLYFSTLFVWLNFANHNYAWLPYKSFLIESDLYGYDGMLVQECIFDHSCQFKW